MSEKKVGRDDGVLFVRNGFPLTTSPGRDFTLWEADEDTGSYEAQEMNPILRNEINRLGDRISFLEDQVADMAAKLAEKGETPKPPETLHDEVSGISEHIVDLSMYVTDKPWRRHD